MIVLFLFIVKNMRVYLIENPDSNDEHVHGWSLDNWAMCLCEFCINISVKANIFYNLWRII